MTLQSIRGLAPLVALVVSLLLILALTRVSGPSLPFYMMPLQLLGQALVECLVQYMDSIKDRLKGPKWLPFLIGLPPLLLFSSASAAFGGYALPKFAQLSVTSYYASSSASHYGVSLLTRHIEESRTYHGR